MKKVFERSVLLVVVGLLVGGLLAIGTIGCGSEETPVKPGSNPDGDIDFPDTIVPDSEPQELDNDLTDNKEVELDEVVEKEGKRIEVSSTLDFGYCMLWQCYERELRIVSVGTATVTIFSTVITQNTPSEEFSLKNPIELEPVQLPPQTDYILTVRYCPQDPGADQAILEITSDDDEQVRKQVTLSSSYKGETHIQVSPDQINFGNVEVRTEERVCRMLSIRNLRREGATDDNKVLTIFSVEFDDPNDINFSMPNYSGSSILLPPDSSTNLQVCCVPQERGEHTNKLYIYHDADVCDNCTPSGEIEIPLYCNGVVPDIQLTPSCSAEQPIDFGEVAVGQAVQLDIEIRNTGDANLEIYDIYLTPQSSPAFYLNAYGLQNATIAPGAREMFSITYSPTAVYYDLGVLVIQSNAVGENSRIQCPVQGRGVISNIMVEPTTIDFGDVLVGQTETRSIRITNTGTATLQITDFRFEAYNEHYKLSDDDRARLPVTILPSDYEDFTIEYTPLNEQNHATTMVIENNSSTPNLSVPVNGRGVSPHIAPPTLWTDCEEGCDSCQRQVEDFEDLVDFGEVRLGDTKLMCLKICNVGYAELVITRMGFGPNTSSEFRYFPEALPPMEHGTCKFVGLFYSPVMYPGPDSGTYFLLSNDTDPAYQRLEYHLQGTAINPRINVIPRSDRYSPYDFGMIYKQAISEPVTFEITNVGVGTLLIYGIHKEYGNEDNFLLLTEDGTPLDECSDCFPVALRNFDQSGDKFVFAVRYTPAGQIAEHSLIVVIENNDYGNEEKRVYLRGAGKECDPPFYEIDGCGPGADDPNCPPDAQWCEYYCANYPPTIEKCNYQDDDCNGIIDDGFPVGETCEGVGACPDGVWECDRNGNIQCSTNPGGSEYRPNPEYCNGVDDDCDGEVDNGTYTYRGVPTNFGVGDPCIGVGECGIGVLECETLWTLRCSTDPGGSQDQSQPEICNGLDDDCDGEADEDLFPYTGNLELYQGQSFYVGYPCNAGTGCGWGKFECDPDNPGGIICSTEPGGSQWAGGIEYCDGLDNDCDGRIDEDEYIYRGQFRSKGEACDGVGACGLGVLECDPRDPTRLICSTDPGGSEDESQPELCNGIDDDCDGEVDEDFSIGEPCPAECISLTGNKCSCGWGTWECDPDDPRQRRVICSTDPGGSEYQGTTEVCDGIDNDCDGEIDNWLFPNINNPNNYGTPGAICLGLGECGTGFYECAGPDYVRCDVDYGGSHYQGQPEVCDGRDNDCDGQTDEDFLVGQPCDGQGECGPGVYECDGLHDVRCSTDFGGSQYEGSPEICDGLDNDCDGQVDEDYGVGSQCDGIGECGQGVIECATTNTTRCSTEPGGSQDQSMPEICDSKDNDCDGVADEDFDLMHDIYNCGYCGHVCQCPNGNPTCNNGTCECNCDPGWYDMDGDPSNGCECQQETSDPGDECSQARQTSPYSLSDNGATAIVTGKLVPYGDVDWYTFYAVDTPDTSCDNFYVRVRFLQNPGDQFRFAILRSSCTEGGNNVLCSEGTDFSFATDFSSSAPSCIHGGGDGSNHRGECPCYAPNSNCSANPNYCYQHGCCKNQDSSCWPNLTNACCTTSGGVNRCTDNSATFYLKVYRRPGAQGSCDQYRIEITNGIFSSN